MTGMTLAAGRVPRSSGTTLTFPGWAPYSSDPLWRSEAAALAAGDRDLTGTIESVRALQVERRAD